MDKFKTKLNLIHRQCTSLKMYNEERRFCTKTELLNFKFILPLAKLDIVISKPVSIGLRFSDDIPQLISS